MSEGRSRLTEAAAEREVTHPRRLVSAAVVGAVAITTLVVAPRLSSFVRADVNVFTVDSIGDEEDLTSSDELCLSTVGTCTLRAAMAQANATVGHDRIEFDIPGSAQTVHRIEPATRLPILTDDAGVTIDGYTQGNARPNRLDHGTDAELRIELDGPGHASGVEGIYIRSSDNVITGLAIFDFDKHVRIYGDDPDTAADDIAHDVAYNEIVGNFIGTDASGTFAAAARVVGADGVHIQHGAFANRIGMPGNEHRNVISGVADRGVGLYDPGTDFNLIQNNVVGVAPDGDGLTNLGNINHGIDINHGSSRNTVGGWNAGEGNVVSGNGRTGIEVSHSRTSQDTERNLVVGNLIGTNADGTAATTATANGEYGIYFEGRALCTTTCPPDIRLNVAAANVVVGSRSGVVLSKGAHDNTVVGNWIGVLQDGSDPFAGSPPTTLQQGVSIEMGAFDNVVEANTIANSQRGVHLTAKDPQCPPAGTTDGDLCRAAEFPVFGNTITMNSIRGTTLQGIELRSRGASSFVYTEGPGSTSEVNAGISAPAIVTSGVDASTTDRIVVTGCATCTVEVFEADEAEPGWIWADRGRGERFLFSGDTDATGRAEFVLRSVPADPMVVVADAELTATVTDASGNTSEFSIVATIPAGVVGEPSPPTTTVPSTTTTTIASSTTTTTTTTTSTSSTTTTSTTTTTTTTTVPVGGGGPQIVDEFGGVTEPAIRCRRSVDC